MANRSEPLINVVKPSQPKVLTGWDQNGTRSVQGLMCSLPQTSRPLAERRSLTHRIHQEERGKPVVLPQGTAPRKGPVRGRLKGRRVKEEGASEGRPVTGRIGVERKATSPTRKRADFPLVSGHEEAGQTDQGGRADDGLDLDSRAGAASPERVSAAREYREGEARATGRHRVPHGAFLEA